MNFSQILRNFFWIIEEGFAVNKNNESSYFKKYNIWKPENEKPNELVSILPLISFLVQEAIKNANQLANILVTEFDTAPSISDNFDFVLTGPHIHHINQLHEYLTNEWYIYED